MISTKGRYALRVMLELAEADSETFLPLKEIAGRQGISEKYLEIILKILVKEKLLKGHRGKGGGYRLTRLPKDYTVGEILELTEGSLAPVACLAPDAETCIHAGDCRTLPMWQRFNEITHDYFYGITLADLMEGRQPNTLL